MVIADYSGNYVIAGQPRFHVYDYFHFYWSKSKILFYAYVDERCSASLTIALTNKLPFKAVENSVSCDVITGKVSGVCN